MIFFVYTGKILQKTSIILTFLLYYKKQLIRGDLLRIRRFLMESWYTPDVLSTHLLPLPEPVYCICRR
ncbi:hypothetical protein SUBVAR_04882 [Subdoligranulum variabile DSM 15176]|uniref:Uncharacterized protein n=1 Tax=Subdoligranulum variabile DSM 15176 TaxID=411471 RepID=D1PKK6_9FIRM|nr:hypothetical protein SUBVAR_04882 [Subdoligranulum variabile DSM 15176]